MAKEHHVYSHDHGGTITQHKTFPSRYAAERYIKDLARAGRATHFYFVSSLGYYDAVKRYSR